MASINQDAATRERQREVCLAVIRGGKENGASLKMCNNALREVGLPTIKSDDEFQLLMNGPNVNDPTHIAARYLIFCELKEIIKKTPAFSNDRPIEDICADLGMTLKEAWALARKSMASKMKRRGLHPNSRKDVMYMYAKALAAEARQKQTAQV